MVMMYAYVHTRALSIELWGRMDPCCELKDRLRCIHVVERTVSEPPHFFKEVLVMPAES